jgi:UPF0716 family protein affecting phage T7 exclusion
LSKFLLVELKPWEQLVCGIAALLMVAPGLVSTLIGIAVAAPVVLRQLAAWRSQRPAAAPST